MPTYDFTVTRDDIINRALRIVGVLSDGDTAATTAVTNAASALNAMVKRWQNDHIFLWTLAEASTAVTQGDSTYTLSNVVAVEAAYIRQTSTTTDDQLTQISFTEYLDTYDKTSQGKPTHFAFDRKITPTVYLYPAPDAPTASGYTLRTLSIQYLADFDSSGDNPDAPSRWIDALVYGLADSLADEYLLPASERNYIRAKAEDYKMKASKADHSRSDCDFVCGAY